jgi:hypothetical protein
MVCLVGARFILGQVKHPYIQSSVARTTDTFLLNSHSRGYKQVREGGVPKSLMRSKV